MKKTLITIVSFLSAISMTIGMTSATAFAEDNDVISANEEVSETTNSNPCGYGILWSVDGDTLTISVDPDFVTDRNDRSKIGDMAFISSNLGTLDLPTDEYEYNPLDVHYPWYEYSDSIKHVEIGEGITLLNSYQFSDMINLETVSIPSTCGYICSYAIPASVKEITIYENTWLEDNAVSSETVVNGYQNSEADFTTLDGTLGKFNPIGEAEDPFYPTEGRAGNNATWSFDTTTQTLEISGTGTIAKLGNFCISRYVKHIVVDDGITGIDNSFNERNFKTGDLIEWKNAESITLPSTLESVKDNAFASITKAVNTADGNLISDYTGNVETTESTNASLVYGDVNLDGNVSIADAVLINKYFVGSAVLSDAQKANADATADGDVNTSDALAILSYIVGSVDSLPWKYDYIVPNETAFLN